MAAQLAYTSVGQRSGETSVMEHSGQVELLDYDHAVPAREPRSQLVKRILTYACGAGVHPRSLPPGPCSSFGVRLAACKYTVEASQLREKVL